MPYFNRRGYLLTAAPGQGGSPYSPELTRMLLMRMPGMMGQFAPEGFAPLEQQYATAGVANGMIAGDVADTPTYGYDDTVQRQNPYLRSGPPMIRGPSRAIANADSGSATRQNPYLRGGSEGASRTNPFLRQRNTTSTGGGGYQAAASPSQLGAGRGLAEGYGKSMLRMQKKGG